MHAICVKNSSIQPRKVQPPKDTGFTIGSRFYDNVRVVLAGIHPVLASIWLCYNSFLLRSPDAPAGLPSRIIFSSHPFTCPPVYILTFASCSRAFETASVKYPHLLIPGTSQINDHKRSYPTLALSTSTLRLPPGKKLGTLVVVVLKLEAVHDQHVPRHSAYI